MAYGGCYTSGGGEEAGGAVKGKMSQSQILAVAGGVLFFLLAAALGWFGWGSLGETQEQAQALAERKVRPDLAAILTRPGGAGAARKEAEGIAVLENELAQQEERLVESWRQGYAQASGAGQGWSQDPNQWKDQLILSYDRLKKQSGKKGDNSRVILADDFYLGLQNYKQQNPPSEKVPDLARQLSVASKLVELLMDAKKSAQEAYPTQCLMQAMVVPDVSGSEPTKEGSEKPKVVLNSTNYLREAYTLQFECSPEVFYGFVQKVVADPWLFVVMNLSLENDMKEFPKRSDLAKKFVTEGSNLGAGSLGSTENPESGVDGVSATTEGSSQSPLLLVLAGKERLKVVMQIDFVGWREPAPGKASPKGKI